MKHNVAKHVETAKKITDKHPGLDISVVDIQELLSNKDTAQAVGNAYLLGLSVGTRYGKKSSSSKEYSSTEKIEHELQYWHSVINAYIFNNQLPTTLILGIIKDKYAVGCFEGEFEPNLILFNAEKLKLINIDSKDDIKKMIVMLFHEMIHQYCYKYGITDTDDYTGEHLQSFYDIAEQYGLHGKDYQDSILTGWTEEIINKQIDEEFKVKQIAKTSYTNIS